MMLFIALKDAEKKNKKTTQIKAIRKLKLERRPHPVQSAQLKRHWRLAKEFAA